MLDFTRDEVIKIFHILKNADLLCLYLNRISSRDTKCDKDTKFPEGFDSEKIGMVLVE